MALPHPNPISLLIAEDDPDDLYFLRRVLVKAAPGAHLTEFADGQSAADYLRQFLAGEGMGVPPSIAFLDIRMPGLTGLELLRWIRSHPVFAKTAVVMLTSSMSVEDIAAAEENGAQCYLSKHLRDQDVPGLLQTAQAFSAGGAQRFDLPINLLVQ